VCRKDELPHPPAPVVTHARCGASLVLQIPQSDWSIDFPVRCFLNSCILWLKCLKCVDDVRRVLSILPPGYNIVFPVLVFWIAISLFSGSNVSIV
jgi:hypothetical protein